MVSCAVSGWARAGSPVVILAAQADMIRSLRHALNRRSMIESRTLAGS